MCAVESSTRHWETQNRISIPCVSSVGEVGPVVLSELH